MVSLMAIPVKADDGEWDVAVGFKAISGDVDTSGSEHEKDVSSTAAYEVNKTSVSESVEVGAIFLEFAGRSGMAGITAGAELIPGSATIGSKTRTDPTTAATGRDSATYTAKAEVENLATFYIEPTIYFNDNFGLYVKGGVTSLELNTLETIASGVDSATYPDKTMLGGVIGGGLRYTAPFGLLVKLEYTETNFAPYEHTATTGNQNRIKTANLLLGL
jgi:hypothetical protein